MNEPLWNSLLSTVPRRIVSHHRDQLEPRLDWRRELDQMPRRTLGNLLVLRREGHHCDRRTRVLRNNHQWTIQRSLTQGGAQSSPAGIPLPSTPVATSSSAFDTSGENATVDTLRIKSLALKAAERDGLRMAASNLLARAGVTFVVLEARSCAGGLYATLSTEKDEVSTAIETTSHHSHAGEVRVEATPAWLYGGQVVTASHSQSAFESGSKQVGTSTTVSRCDSATEDGEETG